VLTEAPHQNSAGEKMYSFTPDVMHHENAATLVTAVEDRWGRMKPALQTQIQRSSTENFAFQTMTVNDAAKTDGVAWVRTAPPEANIPKPPLNNELVQRLVNGEDSALKTRFQSMTGTKVADQVKTFGQQKQLAPELMTKVSYEPNLGPYGTVKMPDSADVDAEVLAAVAAAGDILSFFRQMVGGGTPKLTRARFNELFEKHTPTRQYIAGRFRAINTRQHEWIPCELINRVIDRAATPDKYLEGPKWIDLQNSLRTNTFDILFNLSYAVEVQDKLVPQGHSGAIYGPEPENPSRTDKPQTVGQDAFHTALHTAFEGASDFPSLKAALLAVVEQFAWKGEEPAKAIHPLATCQGAQLTAAVALTKYNAVKASINSAFAAFGA
jgi:hypothetical protein